MTTAIVEVAGRDQPSIPCRALVDTCANANFITEEFVAKLQLPVTKSAATIETLNAMRTVTSKIVKTTIKSRLSNYKRDLTFFTIPRIAGFVPEEPIDRDQLSIPANIPLADPHFYRPAPVDMLIGSGPALASLSIGQINLSARGNLDLVLQKTQLGWIIGGSAPARKPQTTRKTFLTKLSFDLRRFWKLEEGPSERHLSSEEKRCEDHFTQHLQRNETGRYVVALPFNGRESMLGESRSRAFNRFLALERKFSRDPALKTEYSTVINEYLALGHLTQVGSDEPQSPGFYLPHHAVVKSSSATTKVRVVFDGSSKSSCGLSLNDALMIGPTIQDDMWLLLLRFRMHVYALTGDIEKMYRQFLVRPEDRKYQRILWRNANHEVTTYELNTVTFGLSAAPFLAIRCIHQLANDEESQFPAASRTLKRDLYVDDLLTGADTLEEAQTVRNQVINLLAKGGLNIRQWRSNEPRLLTDLSAQQVHPKVFGDATTVKTLGVVWDATGDIIRFTVNHNVTTRVTKRSILSSVAKIFDPLGLLGPVTILAKLMIQQLWQLKVDWDESLPVGIHTEWSTFAEDLVHLNHLSFQRNVTQSGNRKIELHGFCDASERAYGACIYVRSISTSGRIRVHLLCAKSRVAPLKTVPLARLELCGASLLATLTTSVQGALGTDPAAITFWTDSTIVLNWLHKEPSGLKTFVANRVADVQGKTDINAWRHVRSHNNPADLLSRGQAPAQFIKNQHWRHGPTWLSTHKSTWPETIFEIWEDVPERKRLTCFTATIKCSSSRTNTGATDPPGFQHTSQRGPKQYSRSGRMLKHVTAYCLRFKNPRAFRGPLTIEEIQSATVRILQLAQATAFALDLRSLRSGTELHKKSKLLPLNPFIDHQGLLRVGGRLVNSTLSYNQRHPVLLPKSHHVTELIIRQAHLENHHAGMTTTLYAVRQAYWPIDGRNATRKIVRRCVKCFRMDPPATACSMGNLPAARVTEHRPFSNCGVDYCGPFHIKERRHRNRTRLKVFVAVFICFSTKAVHLEVVSDMTTEAFIGALRRFISRRGICKNIYSDNGTNFVGANNMLSEMHEILRNGENKIRHFLTEKQISWHFIPALSPNFGGLWEAAVKCFKHHVKRVVGEELFSFEQFNTFVIEVEAILNSRPLTLLSSDPNDPIALTPGHFLIGDSLTSFPDIDFRKTPSNRPSNWQHIQKVKQDFWARWYKEYISQLNVRQRWTKGSPNITKGTIVVLKEDNLPPLQWRLGCVVQLHPGQDDFARVVTVRTSQGVYKRNVRQLAPLPIEHSV
ncbi:uncharacterized protein LOC143263451 [Megalopta genalis]|uniref:uncharacterized protein LOC143263451 n=1 Tax=Megalopta genalis TaxID=115081 RepID=UPI003FD0BF9F